MRVLNFIRKNPGILSSLVLIVLIPVFIFLIVFFIIDRFQDHIDDSLHAKAVSAKTIFGILATEAINEPEILQEKIEKVGEIQGVVNIQVIIPEQDEFKIVAAKHREDIGKIMPIDPTIIMPWYQARPFAHLRKQDDKRVWYVVDSFYDEKGERAGLISLTLSLEQTDALIHHTIWKSYLILIGIVLIVLLLVAHHTKLFGYIILYNKMKEIDKLKDSFVRMATHELQSPIINIRGHLEALEEEIRESLTETQKELFKRTKISAKNLSDLSQDILEVARIEQGRLDFTPQKISPQEIIIEIVRGLEIKAKQKNINLFLEIEKGPYFIQANSNRFRQILINLIENAIKYTPEGKIFVRTKIDKNKKKYIIEVEDTGLGISAESQKRLFEKFYRVKTKETAGIPGTGLGLWISKNLCETMKGNIFIESISGIGTKFTVIFPLIKGE